jgi:hypothetical protein
LEKFLKIPVLTVISTLVCVVISGCDRVAKTPRNSVVNGSPEWELKKDRVYDGDTDRAINRATREEIKVRMAG